jgi:acetyl esterase
VNTPATDRPLSERYPELDPTYAILLQAARASGLPPLIELAPDAARARVRSGDHLCAAGPEMREVTDIAVPGSDSASELTVRQYRPLQIRTDVVLVWFHGGGWVTGDVTYSDAFARTVAAGLGCEVRSVEYRLAPENPFPAAVEDAVRAVRWSAAGATAVIVGGDSAGGNLAAVATQALVGDPTVQIVGQLLVYPVLDCDVTRPSYQRNTGLVLGVAEMGWFFEQYAPDPADRATARIAPLLATELSGLPPMVIAMAGHDPLHDEGVAYAEALRAAGVIVTSLDFPSLVHGFLRFTGPVAAAAVAVEEIVDATATLL